MKNQNVSLDGHPGQNDGSCVVHTEIDEPPDQTDDWSLRESDTSPSEIQIPGNIDQLHDQCQNEKNDQGVIV